MIVCRRVRFTKGGSVLKTEKILIVAKITSQIDSFNIWGAFRTLKRAFFDTGCYNSRMGTPWLQTGTQLRTSKSQPHHNNGMKCNINV